MLAQGVARGLSELPEEGASVALILDSPLAAQALKEALSKTGWPGRQRGAPMPWCGSLDEAFERFQTMAVSHRGLPPPRPTELRVLQLAQQLLDFRGISESLGGSSKAALELAGQWVEIFQAWEWIAASESRAAQELPGLAAGQDISILRDLQRANQTDADPAAWAMRTHRELREWIEEQRSRHALGFEKSVWFCSGKTPSPPQLAQAKALWGVTDQEIQIWTIAPESSLATDRRLISSRSLEETALVCAQQLLEWRSTGLSSVGIVALDRRALRRVRAVLERAGESISDGYGWALDTTVVATAVMGLNDLLMGRTNTQGVLEWIHCPFVKTALEVHCSFGARERERADQAIRAFGRVVPIDLKSLVEQHLLPSEIMPQYPALPSARSTPPSNPARRTLGDWLEQLLDALDNLGLEEVLVCDAAGRSIMAMLQEFAAKAKADESLISAALWQSMLARELSRARYAEPSSDSVIRVMSLASILWRPPQAVMVLGADHSQLPERISPQFFEPVQLAEMGLQNPPEQLEAEAFAQFASVWSQPIPMTLIAQSETPDHPAEFSNWVRLLSLDGSGRVQQSEASSILMAQPLCVELDPQAGRSAKTSWTAALPAQISVSAAQSLVHCGYQFFARSLLALQSPDDLRDDSPPTDLGSLIHLVLSKATDMQRDEGEWTRWLLQTIDQCLSTAFFAGHRKAALSAPMPESIRQRLKVEAQAMVPHLARWLSLRPITSQVKTEQPVSRTLRLESPCQLVGRIDRWEIQPKESSAEGRHVLIDFKTSEPVGLKARVKPGNRDIQLALYAWLIGDEQTVQEAAYVSVRHDGIYDLGLAAVTGQPLDDLVVDTITRLEEDLQAIAEGKAIERSGLLADATICDQCSFRGVCRRDDDPHQRFNP